ncbi:MAG: hypothetical protein E7292_00510 [Lachnospiraceae bacterium]|nr:hypothetical protein [Lachnospiraceae bacterium]
MKSFFQALYRLSCNFILMLSMIFTGLLFVAGFLFTCYADNMTTQQVLTRADNPLFHLLGVLIAGSAILLCCRLACKRPALGKRILLCITMIGVLLLGALLILFGRTAPAADAWSVYSAAQSLAGGDTSVIHPTDSYLSYYPQQVGLMAFFELIIRIWNFLPIGLEAYHFIKCLYVVLTCIIVFFQYKTVHLLWENDRADCIYLILAGTCLPMIMYSSFVYGEIPSFAALSVGLYYLLKLLKNMPEDKTMACDTPAKRYILPAFISLLGLTLAVMLRKNSLICIIAVVLVVLLEACFSGRKSLLIYCTLCITLSLTVLPITQKCYEFRAGNTLRTGVPAMSYFAMGMQESSRANGWYNGFNFNTYQESGMDTDKTVAISKAAITERQDYFKANPGYAASFYFNKFLSQWTDGTYASRQATLATLGPRHPAAEEFYTGKYANVYIEFCNLYQTIVYLGCFAGILITLLRRRPDRLYMWTGMISVFGGFLFHMIWEANSRYIFLYGLLLIPYAARGLADISNTSVLGKFRKNNTDRTEDASQKQPIAG